MTFYEQVVASVRAANDLGPADDEAFKEHLRTLVPSLHALRASYRSGLGTVEASYSRPVTEAYLLSYYPHYVGVTWHAIRFVRSALLQRGGAFRLCVFAAGPAPEPVALGRFLAETEASARQLDLSLFDSASADWAWARDVSLERVLPIYWKGETTLRDVRDIDITGPGVVADASEALAGADLVVFQNCLNELAAEQGQCRENAIDMIRALRSGAVLVMADVINYPTARTCMSSVAAAIDGRVNWLQDPGARLLLSPAVCPSILRENFFLEGEYPRRNPFEWCCLAAQVK